jgi:hypothetical protein
MGGVEAALLNLPQSSFTSRQRGIDSHLWRPEEAAQPIFHFFEVPSLVLKVLMNLIFLCIMFV